MLNKYFFQNNLKIMTTKISSIFPRFFQQINVLSQYKINPFNSRTQNQINNLLIQTRPLKPKPPISFPSLQSVPTPKMSDIQQYSRMLKTWSAEPLKKSITDILLRIQKLTNTQSQQNLNNILNVLGNFHKQANKADRDKVDEQWFKQVIKCKNHVKLLIEQSKKVKVKLPKLIKSNSHIQYPQQLIKDKDQQYKTIVKSFYKHFLINMDQEITSQNKKIMDFFDKVLAAIFEQFGFGKQQKNKDQQKTKQMFTRIENINKQLAKNSTTMAKKQMISNQIDPILVAKCDPKGFISLEGERIKQQRLDAIIKQNSIGFYDELKKNINKDANQQCRHCKKLAAYCQSQKQIRASDEPMTRFMKCNACGGRWRQE